MLKTLAAKNKSTVTKMAARHGAKVITGDGPRICFEARRKRKGKPDLVARFGGIILRQDRRAGITHPPPLPGPPPPQDPPPRPPQTGNETWRTRHPQGGPPVPCPKRIRT